MARLNLSPLVHFLPALLPFSAEGPGLLGLLQHVSVPVQHHLSPQHVRLLISLAPSCIASPLELRRVQLQGCLGAEKKEKRVKRGKRMQVKL